MSAPYSPPIHESVEAQIASMLRARDKKAKSRVPDPSSKAGEIQKYKLVPYLEAPNSDGVFYDSKGQRFIIGIDPAGNLCPVMLSTSRDEDGMGTPNVAYDAMIRQRKSWMWLEIPPYGLTKEQWAKERCDVIRKRREAAAKDAMQDPVSEAEKLTAYVTREMRPAVQAALAAERAAKAEKPKDPKAA